MDPIVVEGRAGTQRSWGARQLGMHVSAAHLQLQLHLGASALLSLVELQCPHLQKGSDSTARLRELL